MIQLQGVTKTFGAKRAVDGLDLHVRAGELFAFLGPNGAGKTTTIKMVCGLLRPTSGVVRVGGYPADEPPGPAVDRLRPRPALSLREADRAASSSGSSSRCMGSSPEGRDPADRAS